MYLLKMAKLTFFTCGRECDHIFDGPWVEFQDGTGASKTCSKCGALAIDVELMESV